MKNTPIHKLIEMSDEGISTATRPNWWWKQKLSELISEEKEMIERAHREGQSSAGVDPSAYEAMVYYEKTMEYNDVDEAVKELVEYPCYNCQGGGCPSCGGWGVIKA